MEVLLEGFLLFPKLVNPNTNYAYQKDIPGNIQWNWSLIQKLFLGRCQSQGRAIATSSVLPLSLAVMNKRAEPIFFIGSNFQTVLPDWLY